MSSSVKDYRFKKSLCIFKNGFIVIFYMITIYSKVYTLRYSHIFDSSVSNGIYRSARYIYLIKLIRYSFFSTTHLVFRASNLLLNALILAVFKMLVSYLQSC